MDSKSNPKSGWTPFWVVVYRWLLGPLTASHFRITFRRLWYGSRHPLPLFFSLLAPSPWHFTPATQVSPAEVMGRPDVVSQRQDGIMAVRGSSPLFAKKDAPIHCIYRIYEQLCANLNDVVSLEVEYFYFHPLTSDWMPYQIPDPEDPDQVRYAIIASIVETLVESFNWRACYGIQRNRQREPRTRIHSQATFRYPKWTHNVLSLERKLVLYKAAEDVPLLSELRDPFTRRNIDVNTAYFYSV